MNGNGKPKKDEIHFRKKYMDQQRQFLSWVNHLGFEKSFLGRVAQNLDRRFYIRRVALLFLFSLVLAFLMFYDFSLPYHATVGEIASTDLKSPISFQIEDHVATEAKRIEAEKSVPLVFDYESEVYEGVYNRIYKSFREMRNKASEQKWPRNEALREVKVKEFLVHKKEFSDIIGKEVSDRVFEWLVDNQFKTRIENVLIDAISKWSNDKIVDVSDVLISEEETKAVAREIVRDGKKGEEFELNLAEVKNIRNKKQFQIEGLKRAKTLSKHDKAFVLRLGHKLLVPNLAINKKELSERRAAARESVLPVEISIKRNQKIVSAGTIIQATHVTILDEIRSRKSNRRTELMALLAAILFVVLVLVFFSYLQRFTEHRVHVDNKDLFSMGLVTLIVVVATKIFFFMTDAAFVMKYGELIPSSAFLYSAPFAAGPMLVGLLITSGEVVWLFTVFLAAVLSIMVGMNFPFLIVAVITGIAASRGVYACEKRNDIYWAGLRTGLVAAFSIFLITSISELGNDNLYKQLLWNVPAGFVGGILSSMMALMLIPLLETMFNYTTDVKLLELSNLNHPVMQDLLVKAPGTYQHAMAVGNMVDEAAKEINANALLARVMAYYHDIGKMEHAQYFAENQRPGYNPHDYISPYMSKTILVAHVKDGAEMGLEHKLGKPIIDGILQHHGTSLINYFYNKAVEEQDEEIDNVEENDFRYPGPKPQFKEAALVMLADSIEATSRSLDEPTPARLQNIVKNIIQSKFIDGQLDECNLTLKDLSVIEEAFKRTILYIYHHRMDYPHMKDGKLVAVPKKDKKSKGHAG